MPIACPLGMVKTKPIRCSIPTPGVEIVTMLEPDGRFVTEIVGGRLDGDRFECRDDAEGQHEKACRMARMATWRRRRFT